MENRPAGYPEEFAAAIWRRAAELQAEAEIAAERARSAAPAPLPGEEREGLSRAELEAVAAEAGIAPEYVRQALAEYNDGASRDAVSGPAGRGPVEIHERVDAPLAEVYAAVEEVFTGPPFGLVLTDARQEPEGMELVFELPPLKSNGITYETGPLDHGYVYAGRNFESISLHIRPRPADGPPVCDLIAVCVQAERTRRSGRLMAGSVGAAFGTFGGLVGLGVGVKVLALTGLAVAFPAAAAGLVVGGASYTGFAAIGEAMLRRDHAAVGKLLETVAGRVRMRRVLPGGAAGTRPVIPPPRET